MSQIHNPVVAATTVGGVLVVFLASGRVFTKQRADLEWEESDPVPHTSAAAAKAAGVTPEYD